MDLNYNIEVREEEVYIELEGDLDIYSCDDFKEASIKVVEENKLDLVIDAKDLVYIDSTGLGALISIYKRVKEHQNKIIIENLKPNVQKIFAITDLDKIFEIKGA